MVLVDILPLGSGSGNPYFCANPGRQTVADPGCQNVTDPGSQNVADPDFKHKFKFFLKISLFLESIQAF